MQTTVVIIVLLEDQNWWYFGIWEYKNQSFFFKYMNIQIIFPPWKTITDNGPVRIKLYQNILPYNIITIKFGRIDKNTFGMNWPKCFKGQFGQKVGTN